jgi:lysophospholipase L1-like esterase
MGIFIKQLLKIIFIISLFFLFECFGRVYFCIKHGHSLKESFLYENDKRLIYKINPKYKGKHGEHYLGIRKKYFEKDKGDRIRIVCIGGSTTFGHDQFDNSKLWTEILERLLGKERYEVLNAGVAGYGSSNVAARLKKDIVKLEPDIVIIFTGWNLAGSLKSKHAWVPANVYFRGQPLVKRVDNFLVDNSILYIKTSNFIISMLDGKRENIIDMVYKSELPVLEKDLGEMIAVCRDNDIVPVLIKYPARDYNYRRYRDTIGAIERVVQQNDAYLIDCSSYFEALSEEERSGYFTDIAHFSDKGNEKIAEMIYSALIDNGYL